MDDIKRKLIEDSRYKEGIEACLAKPSVWVGLTSYCNFSCVYCSTSKAKKTHVNMDLDLVKSIVDQSVENQWKILFGQTYEPFLHPDIGEIVRYVIDKKTEFTCTTNGTAIRQEVYDYPMNLIISYSATSEDYSYRVSKVSYEKYKAKLIGFLEHRISHLVPGTIHIQIADYGLLEGGLEYDKKIGDIDGIYKKYTEIAKLLGLSPVESESDARIKIARREGLTLFKQGETFICVLATKILPNSYDAFLEIPDQEQEKGYCDSCYTMMSIQVDGAVAFCCCDPTAQATAGKIDHNTNLKEFWLGEEMTSIRDHFNRFEPRHSFCTRCLLHVSENIKPLLTIKNREVVSEVLKDFGVDQNLPWFHFPS